MEAGLEGKKSKQDKMRNRQKGVHQSEVKERSDRQSGQSRVGWEMEGRERGEMVLVTRNF